MPATHAALFVLYETSCIQPWLVCFLLLQFFIFVFLLIPHLSAHRRRHKATLLKKKKKKEAAHNGERQRQRLRFPV